jgi:CMP-N,N'-diacetyllegionaminic acid synthase
MTARPKILAVIPARSGSKRLPGKNLKLLAGKPLLAYAVEAAKLSHWVDRIVLTTDDEAIARVGRDYGAEVPFMRPKELASDEAGDREVFQHCLRWLNEHEKYLPDFVLNLRCTTPLKKTDDINRCIEKWIETDCDSVRSVTRVEGVFHPYWMHTIKNGAVEPLIAGHSAKEYYRSQMLPPVYRLNGVVDGIRVATILSHDSFYGDKMSVIEIPESRAVDIDTELDFLWAEFLLANHLTKNGAEG